MLLKQLVKESEGPEMVLNYKTKLLQTTSRYLIDRKSTQLVSLLLKTSYCLLLFIMN